MINKSELYLEDIQKGKGIIVVRQWKRDFWNLSRLKRTTQTTTSPIFDICPRIKQAYVPEQRFVFWSVPQPPLPLLLIERFLGDPIPNYIEKLHIIPRILSCSSYFSSKIWRSKRIWNVTAPDHFLGLAWAPHYRTSKVPPGRGGVHGVLRWSNGGINQNWDFTKTPRKIPCRISEP